MSFIPLEDICFKRQTDEESAIDFNACAVVFSFLAIAQLLHFYLKTPLFLTDGYTRRVSQLLQYPQRDQQKSGTFKKAGRLKVSLNQGAGFRIVVDTIDTKSEQTQEFGFVSGKVGQLEQIFLGHLLPDFLDLTLH